MGYWVYHDGPYYGGGGGDNSGCGCFIFAVTFILLFLNGSGLKIALIGGLLAGVVCMTLFKP